MSRRPGAIRLGMARPSCPAPKRGAGALAPFCPPARPGLAQIGPRGLSRFLLGSLFFAKAKEPTPILSPLVGGRLLFFSLRSAAPIRLAARQIDPVSHVSGAKEPRWHARYVQAAAPRFLHPVGGGDDGQFDQRPV